MPLVIEDLIVGLIIIDVSATIMGNYSVQKKISDIEHRLTVLETKISCGVGVQR